MQRVKFLLLLLSALLVASLSAGPATAREEILSFDSHIVVRSDGALEVTEAIEVRVEGRRIKRGIFRDFPTIYDGPGGTRIRTSFKVQDVRLNDGSVNWVTEGISNGVRLRVGSQDVLLQPGVYTYSIRYVTERQLYFGDEAEDQLYFNVTGNGWEFPILEVRAVVALPEGAGVIRTIAFTGAQGSKEGAYAEFSTDDGSPGFRTLETLNPGEGLTIVVGWPAGFVLRPDAADEAAAFVDDNRAVFAAGIGWIIVFGYFMIAWHLAGRDPEGGAIIARYEPPKGFSPAAAHFVHNMGFSDTAFTAAIVDMAVKGFLRIEENNDGDMTLGFEGDRTRLSRGERALATRLFSGRVASVEVDAKNHSRFSKAKDSLESWLASEYEAAHFVRNRDYLWGGVGLALLALAATALLSDMPEISGFMMVWLTGWSVGVYALATRVRSNWALALKSKGITKSIGRGLSAILSTLMFLPFLAGIIVGLGFLTTQLSVPAVLLVAAIIATALVFNHLLKAPTRLGRRIMDEIEGFREYLSVAEADRMEFHNSPEKTPALFEKYLPYAIALGVEHEWGEKFDDILAAASVDPGLTGQGSGYHPRWYRSSRGYGRFRASAFSSSMGAAFTGAISSAATAPSQSGGGFSGGGFSGGGGGGGGGGGW